MTWNILHDYKPWEQSIDGNFDGTFNDLDLSDKVPAGAIALIGLYSTDAGFLALKPNGSSGDFDIEAEATNNWGAYRGRYGNNITAFSAFGVVDANSIIEVAGTNATGADIKILGYLNAEAKSSVFTTQVAPASWTDFDLSSAVGTASTLAVLRVEMTSGADGTKVFFRPNGETHNIAEGISTTACNQGKSYIIMVSTDSNGVVEWQRDAASTFDIEVISFIDSSNGWTADSTEVFASGVAPTSWTDLDLSSVVGDVPGFVVLRVDVASGSGTTEVNVRPRSSRRAYNATVDSHGIFNSYSGHGTSCFLCVSTDVIGEIQWLTASTANNCAVTMVGYVAGTALTIGSGTYYAENEEVLNTSAVSNAWSDIDLSPWVGENQVLVYARAVIVTGSGSYWSFRPNGDTDDWYFATFQDGGASRCWVRNIASNYERFVMVPTGTDGKIEIKADGSDTMTFEIMGWVGITVSGTAIGTDEDVSTTYIEKDISAITGKSSAIGYTKAALDTNSLFVYRVVDDTTPSYLSVDSYTSYTNRIDNPSASVYTGALIPVNSSGLIQYASSVPAKVTHYLHSYYPGEQSSPVVVREIALGEATNTDLDLSGYVGEKFALCILKVRRNSWNASTRYKFSAVPGGSTPYLGGLQEGPGVGAGYILGDSAVIAAVPTNKLGEITYFLDSGAQWEISLLNYITGNTPPVLGSGSPTGTTESPGVTISIPWTDAEGASETGLDVDLTSPSSVVHNAVISGVFQTGYGGVGVGEGATSGTVSVSTHPDLAAGIWTVDVTLGDLNGATDTSRWNFTVSDTYYTNRVRHSSGVFVTWVTANSPDTTGASYPGPGTFGVDTSDYCVLPEKHVVKEYVNRAYDSFDGNFYYWTTSSPDTTGTSYPGPMGSGFMTDHTIHRVVYYNE